MNMAHTLRSSTVVAMVRKTGVLCNTDMNEIERSVVIQSCRDARKHPSAQSHLLPRSHDKRKGPPRHYKEHERTEAVARVNIARASPFADDLKEVETIFGRSQGLRKPDK